MAPTINELRKENASLKKQVKASNDKISETEAKYDDLVAELKELKEMQPALPEESSCKTTLEKLLKLATSTAEDIKSFKKEMKELETSVQIIENKIGEFAQYTRINSLLFHGLKNVPNCQGYEFALYIVDAINHYLGGFLYYKLRLDDIEFAHVLPTRSNKANKKSVVLVKFRNRFAKYDIYDNRFKLKGTGISVTEQLTTANQRLQDAARNAVGYVNVWTSQTKILANFEGVVTHVKSNDDIKKLIHTRAAKFPEGLPDGYKAPRAVPRQRYSRPGSNSVQVTSVTGNSGTIEVPIKESTHPPNDESNLNLNSETHYPSTVSGAGTIPPK